MPTTSGKMFPSTGKTNERYDNVRIRQIYENIDTSITKPYPTGLIKDESDDRDYIIKSVMSKDNVDNLPKVYNYRNEMTTVKNQGRLGSCVGFAVAAVKE
jgi:C1A family cysteine protease